MTIRNLERLVTSSTGRERLASLAVSGRRTHAPGMNDWAAGMERMIADLAQAGLAEPEWPAFVVELTAQADDLGLTTADPSFRLLSASRP